jgi:hypothetical protein
MIREAATVILFKEDEAGLKVLMGLRNAWMQKTTPEN